MPVVIVAYNCFNHSWIKWEMRIALILGQCLEDDWSHGDHHCGRCQRIPCVALECHARLTQYHLRTKHLHEQSKMISLPSFVWRPVQVATVRDACAVTVGAVSFPAATAPQAVCCQRQNASEQQRSRSWETTDPATRPDISTETQITFTSNYSAHEISSNNTAPLGFYFPLSTLDISEDTQ